MDGEDINPCDKDYWYENVVKYITGLLAIDLPINYDSLTPKARGSISDVHRHLGQCDACGRGLIIALKVLALDDSVAEEIDFEPVPPWAFARLKNNREFLDELLNQQAFPFR